MKGQKLGQPQIKKKAQETANSFPVLLCVLSISLLLYQYHLAIDDVKTGLLNAE